MGRERIFDGSDGMGWHITTLQTVMSELSVFLLRSERDREDEKKEILREVESQRRQLEVNSARRPVLLVVGSSYVIGRP